MERIWIDETKEKKLQVEELKSVYVAEFIKSKKNDVARAKFRLLHGRVFFPLILFVIFSIRPTEVTRHVMKWWKTWLEGHSDVFFLEKIRRRIEILLGIEMIYWISKEGKVWMTLVLVIVLANYYEGVAGMPVCKWKRTWRLNGDEFLNEKNEVTGRTFFEKNYLIFFSGLPLGFQ